MIETTKWRQKLFDEQQNQAKDRSAKQKAFVAANQELVKQREQYRHKLKESAKMERVNYFPFTHGDLVEKS